jgi:eukaryotic-like serine/threonine-protein kinase
MKTRVFTRDWFAGITIILLLLAFSGSDFITSIERYAYDVGVRQSSRNASDKIAVIAIDDKSIEQIGRFPWSRDVHARLYDILANSGAKVIGQTAFFTEQQSGSDLAYIQQLKQSFEKSDLGTLSEQIDKLSASLEQTRKQIHSSRNKKARLAIDRLSEEFEGSALYREVPDQVDAYLEQLENIAKQLDTDQRLAHSIQLTGNVIFNMPAVFGKPYGRPDNPLPEAVRRNRIDVNNIINNTDINPAGATPITAVEMKAPITVLGEQAHAIGTTIPVLDNDGTIRSDALIVDYYGDYYPSMALLLAANSLNLTKEDIKVAVGTGVQLGRLTIKTDSHSLMRSFFYRNDTSTSSKPFAVDSFIDVLQGKVPASKYKDKIVLIGATALGIGDTFVTPVDAAMPTVIVLAHTISSILNEDFFIIPDWNLYARAAIIIVIALYIMFLLPGMGAATGITVTSLLLAALLVTQFILMTQHGIWLQLMLPALMLVCGHIVLTTKHYFLSEQGNAQLNMESAESHRMLGLSLQGQGQLDMAFEKFRKLPMENSVLELYYNLALDYERKRQFSKAKSVYDHITDFDDTFRDVRKRAKRAQSLENNILLNNTVTSSNSVLALDDGESTPRLGRYTIEAELGKGAMGAVYLGKDPKISRTVAIKTMTLSQEFEEAELDKVKERFFREAETAGRLTHPNIVTIFDADEEHDLAYIAMEYVEGNDLRKYIKSSCLLPVKQVLSIIRRAADAIDYAHSNNVVHRDIKPANVMWNRKTDTLKITDFGIARITDASKTKTGMILGTPSYMSPEQLAGKKVNGQSDIFSLGVMLFQMVTGKLPFNGESMTALMYKIANEEHPSAESINPKVPRCVSIIINRALAKDVTKRYQRGKDMVADIDKCLKIMTAEGKAK